MEPELQLTKGRKGLRLGYVLLRGLGSGSGAQGHKVGGGCALHVPDAPARASVTAPLHPREPSDPRKGVPDPPAGMSTTW